MYEIFKLLHHLVVAFLKSRSSVKYKQVIYLTVSSTSNCMYNSKQVPMLR